MGIFGGFTPKKLKFWGFPNIPVLSLKLKKWVCNFSIFIILGSKVGFIFAHFVLYVPLPLMVIHYLDDFISALINLNLLRLPCNLVTVLAPIKVALD